MYVEFLKYILGFVDRDVSSGICPVILGLVLTAVSITQILWLFLLFKYSNIIMEH